MAVRDWLKRASDNAWRFAVGGAYGFASSLANALMAAF